ncbi:MAG: transcription antitermination factor NusB [Oscillospiraceae bacterium]|nr:transcription antitermination factor NusB [Oscillospiraceae bacterium]
MSRKKAREIVLCLVFEKEYQKEAGCEKLYQNLLNLAENSEDLQELKNSLTESDKNYIKETFFGVFENLEQIDDAIMGSVIGWNYNRISKISMALLRIAVYEIIKGGEDVTPSVAINEAVELSKIYDDSKAYGFVNGVLGSVAKNFRSA